VRETPAISVATAPLAGSLPATVGSRAQTVRFGLVPDGELEEIAEAAPARDRAWIVDLAAGRPGIAKRLAADAEFRGVVRDYHEQYEGFVRADLADRLAAAASIAEQETSAVRETLRWWLERAHRSLERERDAAALKAAGRRLGAIRQAQWAIEANLNRRLTLDTLAIHF